MEINDILNKLGLDLANPEVRKGAMEAIEAILTSRTPVSAEDFGGGAGGGGGGEQEVELDPDLLQPSVKQAPAGADDSDIEIEDEEKILDQIKHNDSEDPVDNPNSGREADESEKSDSEQSTEESEDSGDSDTSSADNKDKADDNASKDSNSDEGNDDKPDEADNTEDTSEPNTSKNKAAAEADDSEELDDDKSDFDDTDETEDDSDSFNDDEDSFNDDEDSYAKVDFDDEATDNEDDSEEEEDEEPEEDDFEDFEFDEDGLIDDELKNSMEDEEIKTKHDARKIKRERTLAAAKKALADAQAKKVAPALIRELEKAIEALEALTEAVTKSLKDISDEEFNLLVNRVFDAIDACGVSDLTFTSEKERAAQVKEIKDDIAKAETQNELSAEDVAKIRAEHQAVKAREKEAAKYSPRGRGTFKGFQDFLNSLYRAVALQVATEETRDDSWSAISRRNSGLGVLRQGQKINELPDKKIPVIDFYFDQSGSWEESDIKIGEKAVQSLAEMEANGQIKINVYYFADTVHTDASSARREGGTSAWNEIVKNVIATQATNVIIMTDWDMEHHWYPGSQPPLKYTVPGYVWYLWKNGENAPRLPRDLKGRGGVQQFSFNDSDV